MGTGQHLDRFGVGAVPRHEPVVVPIGPHEIGQQFGIGGIGLRARDVVAIAVAGSGHRVDRPHLIARPGQRRDPQSAVGLDPHHHLTGIVGVCGDQLVQAPDSGQAFG
jgi:hypothetical protein